MGDDELHCFHHSPILDEHCQMLNGTRLDCKLTLSKSSSSSKEFALRWIDERVKRLSVFNMRFSLKLPLKRQHHQLLHLTVEKKEQNFGELLNRFPNLISLIYKRNKLNDSELKGEFQLKMLQYLDVSFNSITNIGQLQSFKTEQLIYLDLSSNPISTLGKDRKIFFNLKTLKILKCHLLTIEEEFLLDLVNLREFFLDDTVDFKIRGEWKSLRNLKSLNKVYTKTNMFCCFIRRYLRQKVVCKHRMSLYSSCSNLLGDSLLNFIFWFYGVFGCVINFCSTILVLKTKDGIKIYKLLLRFTDFLTSIFFLSIAIIDKKFDGVYSENDKVWRKSFLCKFLGMILQFSLSFSMLILLLLTKERLQSIIHPFQTFQLKKTRLIFLPLAAALSFITSLLPIFIYQVGVFSVNQTVLNALNILMKKRNFMVKLQFAFIYIFEVKNQMDGCMLLSSMDYSCLFLH